MGARPESVLTNVSSQIVDGGHMYHICARIAVFSWWKGQVNCSNTRGNKCSHEVGLYLQGCFFLVEGPSQLQPYKDKGKKLQP